MVRGQKREPEGPEPTIKLPAASRLRTHLENVLPGDRAALSGAFQAIADAAGGQEVTPTQIVSYYQQILGQSGRSLKLYSRVLKKRVAFIEALTPVGEVRERALQQSVFG